jgi:hypothetical protein
MEGTLDNTFATNGIFRLDVGYTTDKVLNKLPLVGNRIIASGHITATNIKKAYAIMLEPLGSVVCGLGAFTGVSLDLQVESSTVMGKTFAIKSDGSMLLVYFFQSGRKIKIKTVNFLI